MALLDFLRTQQAQQPGAMQQQGGGLLAQLLDPSVAMPMAGALMGQQGNGQNFANAFSAAGPAMAQQRELKAQTAQKNKTAEFLKANAPEYAQALEAGMPVNEVWRAYTESRKSQAPQVVELFDEASGQPYKATWNAKTNQYERVGGIKARSGTYMQTNPDGTVTLVQGDISKAPKLTESEGRNAGFLERTLQSNTVLNKLEGEGTSPWNRAMSAVPLGNYGLSANGQKYQQAKRDFVNAILRRESGAVISEQEFANAEQQYFPQPGDKPEVIQQKRANREAAIHGLRIGSGQGAGMVNQPAEGGGVVDYTDYFGGQ